MTSGALLYATSPALFGSLSWLRHFGQTQDRRCAVRAEVWPDGSLPWPPDRGVRLIRVKFASLIHLAKNILGGTPAGRGGRQPPATYTGRGTVPPQAGCVGTPKRNSSLHKVSESRCSVLCLWTKEYVACWHSCQCRHAVAATVGSARLWRGQRAH